MAISKMMRADFDAGRSLSGIGGVETGRDAAEFLLLGAQTVQVRHRSKGFRARGSTPGIWEASHARRLCSR